MSILIDRGTRLIVQGITGREGSFHTREMLDYGTSVVAGVTPGKGGQRVHGVPVFNTVREAAEATGANASILFVPAKFTVEGAHEAMSAGLKLVLTIAEHVPVLDMLDAYHEARRRDCVLIGPNSFGVISPGKAKAGFMAQRIFSPGRVGLMSRSATNCYETVFMMTREGVGQSTCVGIGGDAIPGSTFVDILPLFEDDAETDVIVMIGEIGGDEEELAASYLEKSGKRKPVAALIAGKNAPRGRSMGHAGAIVGEDGSGGADRKEARLREAGARIAESTADLVRIIKELAAKTDAPPSLA